MAVATVDEAEVEAVVRLSIEAAGHAILKFGLTFQVCTYEDTTIRHKSPAQALIISRDGGCPASPL